MFELLSRRGAAEALVYDISRSPIPL